MNILQINQSLVLNTFRHGATLRVALTLCFNDVAGHHGRFVRPPHLAVPYGAQSIHLWVNRFGSFLVLEYLFFHFQQGGVRRWLLASRSAPPRRRLLLMSWRRRLR